MLYYVRLNLSKYALSPIFTHEIPFINLYSNEVKNSNLGITSESTEKNKEFVCLSGLDYAFSVF